MYLAPALTIMRAYLAAGAPEVCGPFGSYAEWSTMVRSPLVWLGEPDPVASIDATQAEDPELGDLRGLCEWWLGELKLDDHYRIARLVEIAHEAAQGFNTNPLKEPGGWVSGYAVTADASYGYLTVLGIGWSRGGILTHTSQPIGCRK